MIEYTVKVEGGDRFWYLNGQLHREDGPAVERANGSRSWYLNGKIHREDGPAVEFADGVRSWWINGELHREDGPAVELANGVCEWYLNGTQLTEAEFNARQHPTCNGKVVEIDGKKYKLMEV